MARFRKRTYRKARKTRKSLAKKVANLTKMVVAQKPEIKLYRAYAAPFIYQSGSLIRPCLNIVQGDSDVGERVGDEINLKSFNFRSYVEVNSAIAFASVRFVLFQYKHNPDAVVSTDSTIINLLMDSALHNTTYFPTAFYDWDNRSAFRILKDTGPIIINHQGPASTATAKEININYTFKNSNRKVQFVQAGATVSKNELILLVISNVASSNISNLYNYQLTYTDC